MAASHPMSGGRGTPPQLPEPLTHNRLLLRLSVAQVKPIVAVTITGVVWMGSQAFVPVAIGKAVDVGIRKNAPNTFMLWLTVIAALFVVQGAFWIIRHRYALACTNARLAGCSTTCAVAGSTPEEASITGSRPEKSSASRYPIAGGLPLVMTSWAEVQARSCRS